MRRCLAVGLLAVGAAAGAGCGGGPRATTGPAPAAGSSASTVLDASAVFRAMGFLVAGPPLPFVATVHYLADAAPDSTLAVFALSLANHALTFQRDGREFVAQYHVEVAFRRDTAIVREFATDETVRVGSFPETQRADESIIYQQFLAVPPGTYRLAATVRDRSGPAVSHQEMVATVPRFDALAVSAPLVVYEDGGRRRRAEVPKLLVNPRALVAYGGDSVRLYVEAYAAARGTRLAARALDESGQETWHDTVTLGGNDTLAAALVVIRPGELPVGQGRFEVAPVGAGAAGGRSTPFLVSFSDQWAITSYEEMISLLRYYERQDWVDSLRRAPAAERPAVWRRFYRMASAPGATSLDQYFERLQVANQRYREGGAPGWLTDRGEVFITLGEPDEVYDFSTDVARSGVRGIRWAYHQFRLTLFFQDQTGFGRYRLTALSRAEYERVLAQARHAR